jgi:hypothetical protein
MQNSYIRITHYWNHVVCFYLIALPFKPTTTGRNCFVFLLQLNGIQSADPTFESRFSFYCRFDIGISQKALRLR